MKKKGLSRVLIAAGALLLLMAAGVATYNMIDEKNADEEVAEVLEQIVTVIPNGVTREENDAIEDPEEREIPNYILDPDREMPTIKLDGYEYIGVLEVPSIELELPIMSTWDDVRLKITPCRYTGSVYQENLVIAGHNYRSHFNPLKKFVGGETVIFTDVEGNRFTYEVGSVETMKGTEVERMVSGDWDLTLFTCTYNGQSRFALRCDLVDSYAKPAAILGAGAN